MRILFVGWPACIHTVRWISNLPKKGFELHFYAWDEDSVLGPQMQSRIQKDYKLPKLDGVTLHFPVNPGDPRELAELIRRIRPAAIHSMPLKGAGQVVGRAKKLLRGRLPPWFVSAWGITNEALLDHCEFGLEERRENTIESVLGACDFLFVDSPGDVVRARSLGFKGKPLQVGTVAGGFDIDALVKLRAPQPSRRRGILLKGYYHYYGRALTVLKAFELCARELADYEIGICSAAPPVILAAQLLEQRKGLSISILPTASYDDWLRQLSTMRVFIGNNLVDGRPNAMVEAMMMGALPIQSNTASTQGWIRSGKNGFTVPHDDPEAIAAALRSALTDDALVDTAAELNLAVVKKKLSFPVVQKKILAAYRGAEKR